MEGCNNLSLQFDPKVLIDIVQGFPENKIMDVGGHKLSVSSAGRIHKWKYVWDASVRDLTTGIEGGSTHYKSRNGAIEHAVEDLLKKNP